MNIEIAEGMAKGYKANYANAKLIKIEISKEKHPNENM
jgi:hypothetical protein